jgi:hypothetical protein
MLSLLMAMGRAITVDVEDDEESIYDTSDVTC